MQNQPFNPYKSGEAKMHDRHYDNLDRLLADRPVAKAPAGTVNQIMARIAALSVEAQAATVVQTNPVKPVLKYVPPATLPLPPLEIEESEPVSNRLNFFLFAGGWSGLCLGILYLIWQFVAYPLLNNYSPWDVFLSWVLTVVNGVNRFFEIAAPVLPTALGVVLGLSALVIVIRTQPRRYLQE